MSELRPALVVFALMSLLTGFLYPLVVTGIGEAAFPSQANGSEIKVGERAIGSRLLGQAFCDPQYFWSRPSATAPQPYNGAASSGSNQGPLNPALASAVKDRVTAQTPAPGRRPRSRSWSGWPRYGGWTAATCSSSLAAGR